MSSPLSRHSYGVILAGGSGTRLWPLSTRDFPKQFLSLGSQESLLAQSAQRLFALIPPEHLWVVCGKKHAEKIARHLAGIPTGQILVEPQAKNTAPALVLAALHLRARDPQALMMVLPADHLILPPDWKIFAEDLSLAAGLAREKKALVTLGVPPTFPATGFGYLEKGEASEFSGKEIFRLRGFKEKPDAGSARQYLDSGNYFWNSGIFVFEALTFLEELQRCRPEMAALFGKLDPALSASDYPQVLAEVFAAVENVSVDYAVMEKAKNLYTVPARFGWDDVGSLEAFTKVLPEDGEGNYSQGDVFTVGASNNLVIARTKPVALVGVEDLVVIDAPHGVLVLPRDKAQDVKTLVEQIRAKGREDLL